MTRFTVTPLPQIARHHRRTKKTINALNHSGGTFQIDMRSHSL